MNMTNELRIGLVVWIGVSRSGVYLLLQQQRGRGQEKSIQT